MIRYVCGFMYNEEGTKVVLILKDHPTWQAGYLNGIGGHIENDETNYQAMVREFEEETGVKTHVKDWQCFYTYEGAQNTPTPYVVSFMRIVGKVEDTRSVTKEPIYVINVKDVFEMSKLKPFVASETDRELQLVAPCIPNLSWLIPMGLDRNHHRAIGQGK